MKPEAQQIAIAEACGFTETEPWLDGRRCFERSDSNAGWELDSIPDYLNDLNAMHEAEMSLNPDQQKRFIEYLIEGEAHDEYCTEMLWDSSWVAAHATAAQRAEAFLRAIGKWEETNP